MISIGCVASTPPINLRHLRNSKFSISSADELFKELIETQLPAQKWNVGRYVAQGVDPNTDIVQLFKAAGFASVEAIDFSTEKIAAECRKQSGLLIFIKETTEHCDCFSHYTIANCVTQSGDIELYDSWKFERLTRLGGDLKAGNLDVKISAAWRIGSPANSQ